MAILNPAIRRSIMKRRVLETKGSRKELTAMINAPLTVIWRVEKRLSKMPLGNSPSSSPKKNALTISPICSTGVAKSLRYRGMIRFWAESRSPTQKLGR